MHVYHPHVYSMARTALELLYNEKPALEKMLVQRQRRRVKSE